MTKVLVLLYKRSDLTWEAFERYWREVHRPLALRMPGLRRYVENHTLEPGDPPYGVAEIYFDDPDAFRAARTSPEGRTAVADIGNFVDLDRTGMTLVTEVLTWQSVDAAQDTTSESSPLR